MKKIILLCILILGCATRLAPKDEQLTNLVYDLSYTNGISSNDRLVYYNASQGIYYLPYDVIASLSRPIPTELKLYDELFFDNPERLGLIANPLNANNPPIGITVSSDPEFVPMYGISCATCHTSLIVNSQKTAFLVDGSGSKFAIDRLIKEMVTSLALTMANPFEFNRFYDRYKKRAKLAEYPESIYEFDLISDTDSYQNLSQALTNNDENIDNQLLNFDNRINLELGGNYVPTTLGYAVFPTANQLNSRAKMFFYLSKRLAWFLKQAKYAKSHDMTAPSGLGRGDPWSSTKNMYADLFAKQPEKFWPQIASGPIDTPFIWKYEDAKWIFTTGTTNSMVERNFAQGIALLADFNPQTYETTVSLRKLEQIQQFTRWVQPPVWPEDILGPIDQQKAAAGKSLFQQHCLNCHNPKQETYRGPGSIEYNYLNVETDDSYYQAQIEDFYGQKFIDNVLTQVMGQVKLAARDNEGIVNLSIFEVGRTPVIWRQPTDNKIAAKPLWGIWATAPYLHNGSVLNMRELLSHPELRLTAFHVGSIEYDAKNMGFHNKQTAYSTLLETNCQKCRGNSNKGHNYGTHLTTLQKDNLIEFLKTYHLSTVFN
jgi:hypothetical protein